MITIVRGHGLQSGETNQIERREHDARSTGDARIGASTFDQTKRLADSLRSRRASGRDHPLGLKEASGKRRETPTGRAMNEALRIGLECIQAGGPDKAAIRRPASRNS